MASKEAAIVAKLERKGKDAYNRVRSEEPKIRGRQVPAGLRKAVARLTEVVIAESEKSGDPYVRIQGVVVEPEEYAGTRMSTFYYLAPTDYQTYEEAFADLCGDLQLLGIDTGKRNLSQVLLEDCAALEQEHPFFFFNTARKASKNGEYRCYIQGLVPADYEAPEGVEEDSDEDDGGDEEAVPFAEGDRVVVDYDGVPYAGTVSEVFTEEEECSIEFDDDTTETHPWADIELEDGDGDEAEDAEDEDEGEDEGEDEDDSDEEEEDDGGDEEEDSGEDDDGEDDWEPAKDDVYGLKGRPKSENYKVISVNKRKQTVSIKNEKTGRITKDVAWDKMV